MSASLDAFAVADPCRIFSLCVMVREHAAIIQTILLPKATTRFLFGPKKKKKKKKRASMMRTLFILSSLFHYFAPMNDNVLAL
jgi:hypothetical protein